MSLESLFRSSREGNLLVVTGFIDSGVSPNSADGYGYTPLMLTAYFGHVSLVSLLLFYPNIEPNKTNIFGTTAFGYACLGGSVSVVTLLLIDPRVDPTIADNHGSTALNNAAWKNHSSVVKLLLDDGRVDPNLICCIEGNTALISAARNCFRSETKTVSLLLADERVEPNITNRVGKTALAWAAESKSIPALETLLSNERVTRTRPLEGGEYYDIALSNVRRKCSARLRGIIRAIVVFRRMRLRAADLAYAPEGKGFSAASKSFHLVWSGISE